MAKEDLMNMSATNEGQENAGNGSAENTQLRFGNGNGDGIGAKAGQAAGSAAKDVAVRTGNRLKKGMKEFGKAASAFLAPVKKYLIIGAIIAIAVVLILVLITAAFKYLLEQGTIEATNDALEEFKDAKLLNSDYLYGYRGQTSDVDEVLETMEFYMGENNQVFTRVASTSRSPVIEPLTETAETVNSSVETVTVDTILAAMTPEEKIYQLLMVQGVVSDGNSLSNAKYGGYIVATNSNYNNNLGSIGSNYKIAPFIATDDEGGTVTRAASQYTTNARTYGDNKDYDTLYSDELAKSNYLLGLGINLNLGPVTDVISEGALYNRSFSGDPEIVKSCITKIMEARKNSNKNGVSISSSLKHYPGYPDSDVNSDHGKTTSDRSMEDINKNIEVFKSGINSGAQSVMVSNVYYNNYDPNNPASLSSKIIGDLRANFDGVIMTDDIGAAEGVGDRPNRYKEAIIAGNDMVLVWDAQASDAYNQINDAVSSGELTEERINESVKRILNWKAEVGLLNASGSSSSNNTQNNNNTTQSGGRTTETITIKQNAAGEYCIAVDVDEKIDNIYNDLKKDSNTLISKFKNEKQAKESLKLWAIAEFSSQYLNLSSDVENYQHDYDADYIQGTVKVKRYTQNDDGTETQKYLTYKTQEEFDTLKANYESSGDTTVFNHFTIDSQDNLVIAKYVKETQDSSWSGTEDPKGQLDEIYTKYTISEQKLNYRNAIVQYAMPYYLFVALTMYGDDAEFTNEVAKLITDSEMIIGIRDNVTTSVTTTYDRYLREEERTESANMTASASVGNQYDEAKGTYIKYSISPSNSIKGFVEAANAQDFEANAENTKLVGIEEEPYYEKKTVKTVITNSVAMNIEYIDGWCFNHKIEYEAKEQDSSTGNNVSNIENTAYETTQAYTKIKENLTDEDEIYNLMTSSEVVRNVHAKATDGLNRDQILLHGVDTRIANYLYRSGSPMQGDAYKVLQNLHNSSEKGLAKSIIYATGWDFSSLSEEYLSSLGITTDAETVKTEAGNLYSTIYNGIRNSDNWDIKIINSYISLNLVEYGRNIRERIVNRTVTTCTDTNTKQYNKISTETVEKTEKNPEPGEENFVSILCDSKYRRVKQSLTGSTSAWFFETLEKSSQTECLIDLLKYLFYKATNNDYGVTEFDFSKGLTVIDISDFQSTGTIVGDTVQAKIWFGLKALGYSDLAVAAAMGNLANEGGFISINVQNSYEDTYGNDEEYTAKVDNGTYTENDFVKDGVGYGLAQWTFWDRKERLYEYAKGKGVSIGDENMQVEFLIKELTPGDSAFALISRNSHTISEWTNDTNDELDEEQLNYLTEAFCWMFENPNSEYAHMDKRKASALQYYNEFHGKTIAIGNYDTSSFIELAIQIHDEIRINNYYYSSGSHVADGGCFNPCTGNSCGTSQGNAIPIPAGQDYIDCSAYVCEVLYHYGYQELFENNNNWQYTCQKFMDEKSYLESQYGWIYKYDISQAQPGDLLMYGSSNHWSHVEIYVGGTELYGAGCTNAIRRLDPNKGSYKNEAVCAITITKP